MTGASLSRWARLFSDLSDDEIRHAMSNSSTPLDKYGFKDVVFETRVFKIFRLAYQLGLRRENMARFAIDFEKFRAQPPSANYDLRGPPFSSLDDGSRPNITLRTNPPDPRLAKVKTFLRRHLTREPSDQDVDWLIYTYFGSDRFHDGYSRGRELFYGMQDGLYNARGMRKERIAGNNVWWPIRRNQRRIRFGVGYNRSAYRYYNSNSNSNSGSNSNSESNSNSRHSNTREYMKNTTRVKKNQNKNEKNKRIQWSKVTLNNAPRNEITLSNFSNGDKAVKLSWKLNGKTHSQYVAPQTFRYSARMSMTDALNKPRNFTLFNNPFTRGTVKRSNIDFVILNLNKRKTVAATKIQKVVRGSQARTKIRRNAERAMRLASIVQRTAAKKNNKKRATARTARAERKEKLRSKRSGRQ